MHRNTICMHISMLIYLYIYIKLFVYYFNKRIIICTIDKHINFKSMSLKIGK